MVGEKGGTGILLLRGGEGAWIYHTGKLPFFKKGKLNMGCLQEYKKERKKGTCQGFVRKNQEKSPCIGTVRNAWK